MELARLTPGPAFAPAQSLLYYTQRLVTHPKLRQVISAGLTTGVRLKEGHPQFGQAASADEETSFQALCENGYAPLAALLSQEQVTDIHNFLRGKRLAEHGPARRTFLLEEVPGDVRLADYRLKDVIDCPHLLELANSPFLLRLATRYVGCKPTISAVGLRWSFPREVTGAGLQAFHRDSDDWRFVKVFVYLTDVDEGSGPHVYVKESHLTKAPLRLREYRDEDILREYGVERVVSVVGPKGFGFAADTYGIHKGAVPSKRPRLLLQFQYSLLPVFAYRYKPESYSGNLALDKYINRLIVR